MPVFTCCLLGINTDMPQQWILKRFSQNSCIYYIYKELISIFGNTAVSRVLRHRCIWNRVYQSCMPYWRENQKRRQVADLLDLCPFSKSNRLWPGYHVFFHFIYPLTHSIASMVWTFSRTHMHMQNLDKWSDEKYWSELVAYEAKYDQLMHSAEYTQHAQLCDK